MRFGCIIGHHRRDSRSIHDAGTHYAASCKHCGKPLVRDGHGRWYAGAGEAPVKRAGKTPVSAIESNRGGPVKGDTDQRPLR